MSSVHPLRSDPLLLCYFHPRTNFFGPYAIFKQRDQNDLTPFYYHAPSTWRGTFFAVLVSDRRGKEVLMVERGTKLRVMHGKFYLPDWKPVCERVLPPDQDGFVLLQHIVRDPSVYLMEFLMS